MKMIEISEDALDTLKRMVEELERDAARYRWIKANAGFGIRKNQVTELSMMLYSMPGNIGALDTAIDAEMNG